MVIDEYKIIKCHHLTDDYKIDFYCDISFRNGSFYSLSMPFDLNFNMGDNFQCYDNKGNCYILIGLQNKQEELFFNKYLFESLISFSFDKFEKITNEIKTKKVYFTFPLINSFFFNIDRIKADAKELSLKYEKINAFDEIAIGRKFKLNLKYGYQFGGGSIGSGVGKFTLSKALLLSSNSLRPLNEFIEVINMLIDLFSIFMKQKLLISDIWSNGEDNNIYKKIQIQTSQHLILNKDYSNENPLKKLASYALIKNNFQEIVKTFIKLKRGDYDAFPVFCDLYMRHNDVFYETLPQVQFLPLMQGIEAYVSHHPCNKGIKLTNEWKKAIRKFKKENPNLPNIKQLKYSNQISFQDKIKNVIKTNNIEEIISFKLDDKCNYKLIQQMVSVRNYYTHYSKPPAISDEDFYDAIRYTQIICEIFIMKELGFKNEQIKTSLNNNYYYLEQWSNKYCSLNIKHKHPKNFSNINYLGEQDDLIIGDKPIYTKYALYYKKENDLIHFYKKELKENKHIQKIKEDDKLFKICEERYLVAEEQKSLRNKTL